MTRPSGRSALVWILPCALSFVASFAVMVTELAEGRILSKQVGASLYAWTSVIGVVLGGITLGNLLGGRLADRFPLRKSLGALFSIAAAGCLAVPLLDHAMMKWVDWDGVLNLGGWGLRVSLHAMAAFLVPSACLGLIGPMVAKLALDNAAAAGLQAGRTVGNVYAWGALGSIVGTFFAGFYLIQALGTTGVIIAVSCLLAALGIALAPRAALVLLVVLWPLLGAFSVVPLLPDQRKGSVWVWDKDRLVLREGRQSDLIYKDESQYSLLKVTVERKSNTHYLALDNLLHAIYVPGDAAKLVYPYEQIYATLTERFGRARGRLSTLFLGGGGYIFPRYVQARHPGSRMLVAEIDPGVTEANFAAFGLERDQVRLAGEDDGGGNARAAGPGTLGAPQAPGELAPAPVRTPIEIYHLDARNLVEDLVQRRRREPDFEPFDFIYGDAFNDFTVPFHLVTREFTLKVKELLRPETGLYLINIIEIYDSGRFLGAIYNTLGEVFARVYVFASNPGGVSAGPDGRDTFIVVGACRDLDLSDLGRREGEVAFEGAMLTESEVRVLVERSRGVVLTDDYSPVENLLEAVVRRRGTATNETK